MNEKLQEVKDFYLVVMENQYKTLQTLAQIAEGKANPVQYQCTPREMILHSTFGWELIHAHLLKLQADELVSISQADTLTVSITKKGIDFLESVVPKETKNLTLSIKQEA